MKMKKMILMLAILPSLMGVAHAADIFPNNCNDGGIYRALGGPNVELNSKWEKSLVVNGKVLIDCKNGNTTTCVGTVYNNYTCALHFTNLKGAEASALYDNFNVPEQANGQKNINITVDGMTRFDTAQRTDLVCTRDDCSFQQVFDQIE
jgi:hypothetical protein